MAAAALSGKISTYNGITTAGNGVPSELAAVDLTTQAAAIAATSLYTPAAGGLFRISVYLKVTRAATTSSTLGAVTITFTSATDSVAQSLVMQLATQAGAAATTNAGNATTTTLQGSMIVNASTAAAIKYAIAYASSGATTMQYEAHFRVEAL
jgi:uncharacterized membrane protein YbhN (UPF0104 family)